MKLSGKKLTTAILAGLMGATMFGGSVFAEVSDQEFNEVRQGVNSKTARISQLENAQLWKLPDIPASKKDIAAEATARDAADQTFAGKIDLISNNQNVTSESDLIKKDQSVGQNLTNVDTALHKEIAARIGADKAQDKVIQTVNDNLVNSVTTINNNVAEGFAALNATDQTFAGNIDQNKTDIAANKKAIGDEAAARDAADQTFAGKIDLISNNQNVTSESDLIKKDQSVGQNLTNVDTALHKEIAARIGADKAQDKVIQTVNDNLVNSVTTINNNVAEGFAALNATDQTFAGNIDQNKTDIAANKKAIGDEAAARDAADQKLQGNIADEATARQADISRLDNKIHDVSKEVDTVGALSMAMSGLHPLSYDEGDARFQLSAAVGTYDGTEALALGGFYHFNRDSMLSVGVATDLGADEHRMGANVGYTRRIGQGGHVSRPSEGTVSDIMKDIKNLEQKQAKLEQENEQLKQQLAALKK